MMMPDIRQTQDMPSYKSRGATKKGQGRGETGGWWEWRAVGWQGYKIRIYVCIASRILDPLSQESTVLEMELFESAFQARLCVQVVSSLESNAVSYVFHNFNISKPINCCT